MSSIRPEAVVRCLDDLDAAAFAMRVFWAGAPARLLARVALLSAGLAGGLLLTAAAAG